eukprot:g3870.t1
MIMDDDGSSSSSSDDEDTSLADMLKQSQGEMKKEKRASPTKTKKVAVQANGGSRNNTNKMKYEDESPSSSSDEETLADMMARASSQQSSVKKTKVEDDDSDESEDDMCLADLKKIIDKKNRATEKRRRTPKKNEKKRKKTNASSSSSAKKKGKKTPTKKVFVAPTGQRRISRAAGTLLKPQLVEAVLVRWNYCMKWPKYKDGLEEVPCKKGYVELRGFKGVLVGVMGDETGCVIDFRDMSQAPTFNNLITYRSDKLKEMAREAIEKQIKILEIDENVDKSLIIKGLRVEHSDIAKVNSERSDKQWTKRGW